MDLEIPVEGDIVQHCNSRTNYDLIVHEYHPDECDECKIIQRIIQEGY